MTLCNHSNYTLYIAPSSKSNIFSDRMRPFANDSWILLVMDLTLPTCLMAK